MADNRFAPPKSRLPAPPPPKQLGTIGTIALLVGVGALGMYMLDLHGHTCDQCGYRWRHLGAFNLGDEESHTCSQCGGVQWWKNGVPHVLRGSQFIASPRGPESVLPPPSTGAYGAPALPSSYGMSGLPASTVALAKVPR